MKENKKEKGKPSKSGKTILRISKSGKEYWFNPKSYELQKERLRIKKEGEGLETREWMKQRVIPICHAPKSEYYMKYFQRKCEIRAEYPKWVSMSIQQHKEYFKRVLDLLQTDPDLRYYMEVETETQQEKWKRERFERKMNEDYDGAGEDYR